MLRFVTTTTIKRKITKLKNGEERIHPFLLIQSPLKFLSLKGGDKAKVEVVDNKIVITKM